MTKKNHFETKNVKSVSFQKMFDKKSLTWYLFKKWLTKKGLYLFKKRVVSFQKKKLFFCLLFLFAFFEKIQGLHFLFQIVLGMDTRKPYLLCPRGGIGRRSRFRIYRLTVCRFESDWGYLFFYNITKKI